MDKLATLKQLYQSFSEEETPRQFFLGLLDYIDLVDHTPEFKRLVDELDGQRRVAEKEVWKLKHPALKALEARHKTLVSYLRKNKIEDIAIEEALKDYDAWKAGNIQSSQTMCSALEDELADIVSKLYYDFPKHKVFATKFIAFQDAGKTLIKRIGEIPEVSAYEEANEILKSKNRTEVWGEIPKLGWIYQVIKNGKERVRKLALELKEKKNVSTHFEFFNFAPLVGEWEVVERGETSKFYVLFDRETVGFIVKRLHNYLLAHVSFETQATVHFSETTLIANPPAPSLPQSFQPHLYVVKDVGYIQIYKNYRKIRIGRIDTRKFKLIRCLFSPENNISAEYQEVAQIAERVLEKIALPKDKKNTKLKDLATRKTETLNIIENAVKEVQKIKSLQGIVNIEWLKNHQQLRLHITPREGNI